MEDTSGTLGEQVLKSSSFARGYGLANNRHTRLHGPLKTSLTNHRKCKIILGSGLACSFFSMFFVLAVPDVEPSLGPILIGAIMFVVGVMVFLLHPHRNLTATSVFSLSCAIFIGVGAVCTATMIDGVDDKKLLWTTFFFCLSAHVTLLSSVLSSLTPKGMKSGNERHDLLYFSRIVANEFQPIRPMVLLIAVVIFLTATLVVELFASYSPFAKGNTLSSGLLYISIVIIVYLGTLCSRLLLFKYGICALMFMAYYVVLFSGYGRLQLIALGLTFLVIVLANTDRDTSITHYLIAFLVCLIPFSVLAAYIGQIRGTELTVAHSPDLSFSGGKGLESALFLLQDFVRLLDGRDGVPAAAYPFGMGDTYWKAMVWLVPRKIWPDKPEGFGAELAEILDPQLAYYGHTTSVTAYGELFYNFGWTGVLLGGAILGWIISKIDRVGLWIRCLDHGPVMRLFLVCAYSLLCSGMVDLAWGGLATFVQRSGTELILLVGLSLAMALIAKPILRKA